MFPDSNGITATNIDTNLDIIMNTFCPNRDHPHVSVSSFDLSHLNNHVFTFNLETIRSIIFDLKKHKAPCCDGISPIILQNSFEIISTELLLLYRALLKLKYFP